MNKESNGKFSTIIVMLLVIFMSISFNSFLTVRNVEKKIDNLQKVITEQTENLTTENQQTDFEQFIQDYSTVNTNELLVVDESQLTEDLLLNRNGKLIISKCVGKVVSEDKDGCIINKAQDKDYDYISYRGVKGAEIDDIIVTYLIYNPDNNYTDDIIYRFDYIVSQNINESEEN